VKGTLWRKRLSHQWGLFCQDRLALSGLVILGLFIALALLQAAWMAMGVPKIYDPIYGYDFSQAPFSPPNASHWLGTDSHGRDVLSQLIFSVRFELVVALLAALITVVLGTSMGVVAAYYAGSWADALLMRLSKMFLVIPPVAFIFFLSRLGGFNHLTLGLTIGVLGGGKVAMMMKARALEITVQPYISAARIAGGGSLHILWRHVIPNVIPFVFMFVMFIAVIAILAEALLSFFGTGSMDQGPGAFIQMSWGYMLFLSYYQGFFNGGNVITYWWLVFPAAAAIMLFCSSLYFVGRGFHRMADPSRTFA
ncbi:MAG TPA: ABC transporter permease, partial [Candidatus Bipolaricaulota bacterium]